MINKPIKQLFNNSNESLKKLKINFNLNDLKKECKKVSKYNYT